MLGESGSSVSDSPVRECGGDTPRTGRSDEKLITPTGDAMTFRARDSRRIACLDVRDRIVAIGVVTGRSVGYRSVSGSVGGIEIRARLRRERAAVGGSVVQRGARGRFVFQVFERLLSRRRTSQLFERLRSPTGLGKGRSSRSIDRQRADI